MKTSCLVALGITALQVLAWSAQGASPAAGGIVQAVAAVTNSPASPQVKERCKVDGTDDVVTFFADGSAELSSRGNTLRGVYRYG